MQQHPLPSSRRRQVPHHIPLPSYPPLVLPYQPLILPINLYYPSTYLDQTHRFPLSYPELSGAIHSTPGPTVPPGKLSPQGLGEVPCLQPRLHPGPAVLTAQQLPSQEGTSG